MGVAKTTAAILGVYLAIGLFWGLLAKTAIPAINPAGVAYIAASWPAWLRGSPLHLPVPTWAFSFQDPTHDNR
jgi:hypothetical protein